MTELKQYEKGYSPSALQRKYSSSYEQGYELAQDFKRLQEQLNEANDIIKEYVETTPKVPNDGCHIPNYNLDSAECYLEKWGVK